ncbi:hypothetical protein [Specibacter cremeus]|uniref:hypothetical protein n=1 Tax=Specibacter cremeus TaxID=1629051 RepID=UPI000F796656|nr:hypothetical protein [Specibacter cremeus]
MARRRRAAATWLVIVLVTVGLLAGGGIWVANAFRGMFAPPLAVGCTASVGDAKATLATDQAANAALISAISVRRGMPARAASIGLAVAMQESKLRNITHGDMDSLGLFQQRPSQGWGTEAQILDPVYSANAFFNELDTVTGYADMPITEAAQVVQRSAYPAAYAKHESVAKAFASALTGNSPGALSCTLADPTKAGSATAVTDALAAAYGNLGGISAAGATVTIPASDTLGWSVAQWAVANASALGITEVAHDGKAWVRSANDGGANVGWRAAPSAAGTVVITVRGGQ